MFIKNMSWYLDKYIYDLLYKNLFGRGQYKLPEDLLIRFKKSVRSTVRENTQENKEL